MTAITLVVALSTVAFDAGAANAGPVVPRGHACLEYDMAARIAASQAMRSEATASGEAAECYGGAVPDDRQLRWQLPRMGRQQLHMRF